MPLMHRWTLLLALVLTLGAAQAKPLLSDGLDDGLLPVEEAFRLLPPRRNGQTLRIEWSVSPGYYLYRDRLIFEVLAPQGFRLTPPRLPSGESHDDAEFGRVTVFRGIVGAEFVLPPGLRAPLKLRVRYQGCADVGICYPPQAQIFDVPALRS